jgi:hypothetical protein
MPIDYSKWDTLECSDSDEEEASSTPRVTRLEEPSRVTFGGSGDAGTAMIHPQQSITVSPKSSLGDKATPTSSLDHSITNDVSPKSLDPKDHLDNWTSRGGSLETSDQRTLFWSQDRYSVQLRLELKDKETIHGITIDGILPYSERHCATGSHSSKLSVLGKESAGNVVSLLQGNLPHPVYLSQDDDPDQPILDWSIERHPLDSARRFVTFIMHKAVPMQGLFVWWKRPLLEFEESVLDDEECGRSAGASNEFLQSWEEAHRLFREKKTREPHPLPL